MSDPAGSVTDVNMTRADAQASSLPAFPRVPALQYATQLDPDRIAGMSPTPANLRRAGALAAATADTADSTRRPQDIAIARRRLAAALENAAGASAGASLARRHGNTAAAVSWQKRADALLAAAAMLTNWIDWLEADARTSHDTAGDDEPAAVATETNYRPAWHPPPGITQAARGPLSPRAPARALERTEA